MVLSTVNKYCGCFVWGLDLFIMEIPYGVLLAATFVGNELEKIQNQLRVERSEVPQNTHEINNAAQ